MRTETLPLEQTHSFSQLFIDYINQKKELYPYYSAFPRQENFKQSIENRDFNDNNRKILVDTLKNQYEALEINEAVSKNIHALRDSKTFSITTGHQLNIFTGPLYFIYKIVTVINTCKNLKQAYADYNFVPIYWMASEDHDFEEINYFSFEGRKYQWDTNQTGAVGRFNPSGLREIAQKLPSGSDFFKQAYSQKTLSDAVRVYVNYLFESEGVVVLDADEKQLKKLFSNVMEDDLFVHSTQNLVEKTSASLKILGYKTQVHARQINFFYLHENIRKQIEKTDRGFQIVDTDIQFSDEEMRKIIRNHPDRLSPNVILRPLYQETILPNLGYVGGPSEVAYWLQLKAVFDHFETAFPLIIPRNFALIISETISSTWKKTGLGYADYFKSAEQAFVKWVKSNSNHDLSYSAEIEKLKELEKELKQKALKIDPTLTQHIESLHSNFRKRIQKAEKKLLRSEKRKHEYRRTQIQSVKEALFPDGSLQERKDNFLNFYLTNPQLIQKLSDTFDPFNYQIYLLFCE